VQLNVRNWDRHIIAGLCFLFVFVSIMGYIETKEYQKKHTCECISVQCDCVPGLCRCGGVKTCTESCYQEAKRQGRVK